MKKEYDGQSYRAYDCKANDQSVACLYLYLFTTVKLRQMNKIFKRKNKQKYKQNHTTNNPNIIINKQ